MPNDDKYEAKVLEDNAFIKSIYRFIDELEPLSSDELRKYGSFSNVSLLIVDMINGFCRFGPLSSPRVGRLEGPVFDLATMLKDKGLKEIAFLNDAHGQDAAEFSDFPPHAVKGTGEAEIVDSLKGIAHEAKVFQKNSLNAFTNCEFRNYIDGLLEQGTRCFIVVGNCTDLCIYQTAMTLKMILNSRNVDADVFVPYDCVDTFDSEIHKADLMNAIFLYHMNSNGIRVIRKLML